jgi:hypothetical protein
VPEAHSQMITHEARGPSPRLRAPHLNKSASNCSRPCCAFAYSRIDATPCAPAETLGNPCLAVHRPLSSLDSGGDDTTTQAPTRRFLPTAPDVRNSSRSPQSQARNRKQGRNAENGSRYTNWQTAQQATIVASPQPMGDKQNDSHSPPPSANHDLCEAGSVELDHHLMVRSLPSSSRLQRLEATLQPRRDRPTPNSDDAHAKHHLTTSPPVNTIRNLHCA